MFYRVSYFVMFASLLNNGYCFQTFQNNICVLNICCMILVCANMFEIIWIVCSLFKPYVLPKCCVSTLIWLYLLATEIVPNQSILWILHSCITCINTSSASSTSSTRSSRSSNSSCINIWLVFVPCAFCRNPTSFYHAQGGIQLIQPGAPERGRGRKGGRCF